MAERIDEVHRPRHRVIDHASDTAALRKADLSQASDERQPLIAAEPERHPVETSRGAASLGLADKKRELGATTVR